MPNHIFEKFTANFKQAVNTAYELALALKTPQIGPEYLLYALAKQKGSVAAEVLAKIKIKPEEIKNRIMANQTAAKSTEPELSPTARKAVEKAILSANRYQHRYIGTEHLLAGLSQLKETDWLRFLYQNQIPLEKLKSQIILLLKSASRFSEIAGRFAGTENREMKELREMKEMMAMSGDPFAAMTGEMDKSSSALEIFTTNLTDSKIQSNIDPVIGREEEIQRLIQIISRRTKNNPVLLGEPGVGKTAIVEGLAKKIMNHEVPDVLINKKILSLDLGLTVAGTMFRGEFENRLKQIIEEIKNNPDIILFIDELHNIIGAGSAQGSLDAANILKPALARGQLRCIGATTLNEYKKHIENDPALERRFQPILVDEPTAEKTKAILRGIKNNYEKYHRVTISDEAMETAIALSQRYLPDKFLPDKAIDLIDEAASRQKIKGENGGLLKPVKQLEAALEKLHSEKEQAVSQEDFDRALNIKREEIRTIEKLNNLKSELEKQQERPLGRVNAEDIAELVARMTKIPLTALLTAEKNHLLNLEKIIGGKIIGQAEAIKNIAQAIRRARAGLANHNRPLGSFIFLGPSGVGKTELAKVLAETVFESPDALIRLDMSEFHESFNISKLIGAPAGYVGYKDANQLTDAVKHKPYSVVLFDEIEKAHPEVFNLLLQILEDGQLTDAAGKKINFKNTIIIMTSNVGLKELNRQAAIGFTSASQAIKQKVMADYELIKKQVIDELKERFRPEFLNRIDKIIVFKPLATEAIKQIVELQLAELNQRLQALDLKVIADQRTKNLLTEKSFSPQEGARAVRKTMQELLEDKLADKILKGQITKGVAIKTKVQKNQIVLT